MPKIHSGEVHNIFEKSLNVRQILLECLEAISKTFQMFLVEMRYFSKVLDQRHILFNIFVYIIIRNILRFLCTKSRFQNVLCRDSILFGCFESKEDTFQTCWVEFRYISNYFGTKRDTFQMFWVEIRFFSNVLHQIQYYSNVCSKIQYF